MAGVTKPDYLALLEARAKGSAVRTVKRPICLAPELLDDLQRAERAVQAARLAPQRYADAAAEAKATYDSLKDQIAELSVVGVFQVPTPEEQAVYTRDMNDSEKDEAFAAIARKALTACYRSMLDPDGKPLEYSREKFAELTKSMWSGELLSIFGALMAASNGEPDFS